MKIKEFLKSPKGVVTILVVLFFAAIMAFAVSDWFGEKKVDSEVQTQTTEATRQIGIAEQSISNANVSAGSRVTEDIIREKVIRPRLEETRRKSSVSKAELETATKEFNDAKNNLHNLNVTRADNCRRLGELFPDERFEYCSNADGHR
jgi:hypothetical protein